MKKLIALMMTLTIFLNVPAFAGNEAAIPGGALGLDVLGEVNNGTGIAIVSPQSLYIALGMAAQGARGDTLSELLSALNAENLTPDNAKSALDALKAADVKCANAYFSAADISLKPEYADVLSDSYSAQGFALDADVVERVNDWASKNTDGMIREVLKDKPDDSVKLVLLNALMLNAKWRVPFKAEATFDGVFHGAGGDETVAMMHRRGDISYAEINGAQVAYLPYEAEGLGMYVILPGEGGAAALLEDMARRMAEGGVPDEMSALETRDVSLALPRVKADFGGSLREALLAAGLTGALNTGADFTGMTDDFDLFIGDVIQKCALEVGEDGTRAAAVTVVKMEAGCAREEALPVLMTVDRPYIMLITLSGEGGAPDVRQILFAAVVNDAA